MELYVRAGGGMGLEYGEGIIVGIVVVQKNYKRLKECADSVHVLEYILEVRPAILDGSTDTDTHKLECRK